MKIKEYFTREFFVKTNFKKSLVVNQTYQTLKLLLLKYTLVKNFNLKIVDKLLYKEVVINDKIFYIQTWDNTKETLDFAIVTLLNEHI